MSSSARRRRRGDRRRIAASCFALAVAASFTVCAASLPAPTPADAARASARWPDASLAELERGRATYVKRCAGCHTLPAADAVPPDKWSEEIADMRTNKGVAISDAEAQEMTRYLWSVGTGLSRRAKAGDRL